MINCKFESGNEANLRHIVVDCLVLRQNQILLVKRNQKLSEGGKWGLVGGYMERDETLVQCVEREVLEETGWKVKGIERLTIIDKPNRPNEDRQNVSIVFVCKTDELVGKPDWESEELKWFDLNDLPEKSQIAFDHFETIQIYKNLSR